MQAEKNILNRTISELTALTGYAGGTRNSGDEHLVCYHNFLGTAEYSTLGHTEVVRVTIPKDKFRDFAEEYFKLFDKKGDRPDKRDVGAEYRHAVGIPGGVKSPFFY